MNEQVQVIKNFDDLPSVKKLWEELSQRIAPNSTFRSYDYVNSWYRCFAEANSVRVFLVYRENELVGLLPLVALRKNAIRILQSITNDHCFHSDPLVKNGNEQLFQDSIVHALRDDKSSWDIFKHEFSYSFSQLPGLVPRRMLAECNYASKETLTPTFVVQLNKSFDEYVRKDLSKNMKTSLARFRNRLQRTGPYSYEHYVGRHGAGCWDEFVDIEDSGWKGKNKSSIRSVDAVYGEYYRGLVGMLADRNALHMYFLNLDGKRIAGVFGYVDGDNFHWSKTAYREEHRDLSPANMLLMHIIEDLMTNYRHVAFLHMFPWDYGYKHRFANVEATCIEKLIFNRTIRGNAMLALDRLKKFVKSNFRRI